MRLILFCLTIIVALNSCKKEELKLDINSYWQCNKSQNLDTTAISNKLLGSWVWSKKFCFWEAKTILADKNIKVTFNFDRTFFVNEGSSTLTQGTWKLKKVDVSSWGLDLTSTSEYLYGHILFCDNQVLFNDSYIDGCDYLFNKNN
jgi:hypothetical protein